MNIMAKFPIRCTVPAARVLAQMLEFLGLALCTVRCLRFTSRGNGHEVVFNSCVFIVDENENRR